MGTIKWYAHCDVASKITQNVIIFFVEIDFLGKKKKR